MDLDSHPASRAQSPVDLPTEPHDVNFRLDFMIDFFWRGSKIGDGPLDSKLANGSQNEDPEETEGSGGKVRKEKKKRSEDGDSTASESLDRLPTTPAKKPSSLTNSEDGSKSSKKSRTAELNGSEKKPPKTPKTPNGGEVRLNGDASHQRKEDKSGRHS